MQRQMEAQQEQNLQVLSKTMRRGCTTYHVLEVGDLAPDLAVLLGAHLVHGGLQVVLQQLQRRHRVLLPVVHRHEPQLLLHELAHLLRLLQLRAPLLRARQIEGTIS